MKEEKREIEKEEITLLSMHIDQKVDGMNTCIYIYAQLGYDITNRHAN